MSGSSEVVDDNDDDDVSNIKSDWRRLFESATVPVDMLLASRRSVRLLAIED